ncbi:MAG: 1-aminocyclopropane-1-carboxylate deaminase/D-cysteine desulfhydrase [Desulfatibacillaceae bacterium]
MTRSDNQTRPLLFALHPGLAGKVEWMPLCGGATPVRHLPHTSRTLGREVFVKDDSLVSPVYGGNKPRKLEFLLAHTVSRGQGLVVTCGGLGTNHGLATAVFARRLGLEVELVLMDQPVTADVRHKLLCFAGLGARIVYAGSMWRTGLQFGVLRRLRHPRGRFIPPGGSDARGALGFVEAGLELALQVERGEIPEPAWVVAAAGTCGTVAGLALGLRLGGLSTRVMGVRVAPALTANTKTILALAGGCADFLRHRGLPVRGSGVGIKDLAFVRDHMGAGYGRPTPAGRHAMTVAANDGLVLDPTYTAKAFAAMLDRFTMPEYRGPILFWHTYNGADTSQWARAADEHRLPGALRRFFRGPEAA